MLKKLYYKENLGIPWISVILIITCSIVSLPTYINNEFYDVFALKTRPVYWWQYFIGQFEHSIYPGWFFWAHYLCNMSVIILFGVLIERVIGSKKMFYLVLVSGVLNSITVQAINSSTYCTESGISGVAWAFAPIACYTFVKVLQYDKREIRKEILFYIMIFEFFLIWIFVTAVSPWDGTNTYHAVATIAGIIFLLIWRKQIKERLNNIFQNNLFTPVKAKTDKFLILIFGLLPLFVLTIFGLYHTGNLDGLYTQPLSISSCSSLDEINQNGGKININFEAPVYNVQYKSTSTPGEGIIKLNINFSNEYKNMILSFDQSLLEKKTGTILLKNIYLENGKKVKSIKIEF